MPQRASQPFNIVHGDIVDTTPEGSVNRTAAYTFPPTRVPYDTTMPVFGTVFGPSAIVDVRTTEQVEEMIERRRAAQREQEERFSMYGQDGRARDHVLRGRMNRRHPHMFRNENPDSDFWREDPQARERRAIEEEVQEDNRIGRLRAQARQRNEAFNEQAARNVRRRTTSEGVVLAHARQANLFG